MCLSVSVYSCMSVTAVHAHNWRRGDSLHCNFNLVCCNKAMHALGLIGTLHNI